MIKVKIDEKEYELTPEQLELGEGYGLITPDNVPKGYLTQELFDAKVQERIEKVRKKTEEELLADPSYEKRILDKFQISLGEDGKPKGLKADVDVDEIRSKLTQELSGKYETQLKDLQDNISNRDKSVISNAILNAIQGEFEDIWLDSVDGETPLGVEKFAGRFKVDSSGREYAVDDEGNTLFKNDGKPMRAKDYFSDASKFERYMKDKRQRGSGFNGGNPNGNPNQGLKRMSISPQEKAKMFESWRKEGKKPLDEWNKIPYK